MKFIMIKNLIIFIKKLLINLRKSVFGTIVVIAAYIVL